MDHVATVSATGCPPTPSGDARESVVPGLSGTGRVISAAAAIMVAVFLGLASEVDVTVLGVGWPPRSRSWLRRTRRTSRPSPATVDVAETLTPPARRTASAHRPVGRWGGEDPHGTFLANHPIPRLLENGKPQA